jgi:septum formation protein
MNSRFDFVWLASQSPRRRALLEQVGVRHRLLLPDEAEDAEALEARVDGESPERYVERVTRAKLEAAMVRRIRRGEPEAPVLCADTTVALGHRILGKPADANEACATLRALSGRSHRVLTSVAVACGADRQQRTSLSLVHVADLPDSVIETYVAGGEPFGKAGAYAIQGALAGWISRIEGSHSGIMGLPLFETVQMLREFGVATAP